jgi:hypothetical protein
MKKWLVYLVMKFKFNRLNSWFNKKRSHKDLLSNGLFRFSPIDSHIILLSAILLNSLSSNPESFVIELIGVVKIVRSSSVQHRYLFKCHWSVFSSRGKQVLVICFINCCLLLSNRPSNVSNNGVEVCVFIGVGT